MTNFGLVPLGAVLPVFFASYAASTGASATLSGLAVTDIEIYKDTSMTQRASDAGYTLLDTDGIDLDGVTGINGFSIDTGDNTTAGFFAAGSFYTVVVSSVTIDSQTVNFVAATFRLGPAEDTAGYPKVTIKNGTGTGELSLSSGAVKIQAGLKRNQAITAFPFQMVDETTEKPFTGATVTVTRSIDGGAFGAGTIGSVTEVSGGWYEVDLGAGDMNGATIALQFAATGCKTRGVTILTEP